MTSKHFDWTHLFWIALLTAIAAGFRYALITQLSVINGDGIVFLGIAKDLSQRSFVEVASVNRHHLLFSYFVQMAHRWISDWEFAGRIVSLVFGSAAVIPVYLFSYNLFRSKTVAFWGGLLFALSPYLIRNHAQVFTEGTFHFFFLWSVYFGYLTVRYDNFMSAILCGLTCSLAYLARPEGVGVGLVVAGWIGAHIVLQIVFANRLTNDHWIRVPIRIAILFLLLISFAIPALPYLSSLRESNGGHWTLTQKKKLGAMLTFKNLDLSSDDKAEEGISQYDKKYYYQKIPNVRGLGTPSMLVWSVLRLLNQVFKASYPPIFVLIVLGLIMRPTIQRDPLGEGFIALLLLLYALVYVQLAFTEGYLTKRHVLTLVTLLSVWGGVGLEELCRWISRGKNRSRFWKPQYGVDIPAGFKIVAVLVLVLITLPKSLKTLQRGEIVGKQAGLWLKEKYGSDITIVTNKDEVGFYSVATYYRLQPASAAEIAEQLKALDADFLAFDTRKDLNGFIRDEKWKEIPDLVHLKTLSSPKQTIMLFEVKP